MAQRFFPTAGPSFFNRSNGAFDTGPEFTLGRGRDWATEGSLAWQRDSKTTLSRLARTSGTQILTIVAKLTTGVGVLCQADLLITLRTSIVRDTSTVILPHPKSLLMANTVESLNAESSNFSNSNEPLAFIAPQGSVTKKSKQGQGDVASSDRASGLTSADHCSDQQPAPTGLVKCLHIINGEHYSGAERVQDLLGLSMDRFGYEVHFAALKDGKFDQNRRSTCPFHLEKMHGRWDFSITKRLGQWVRKEGFKVLHAHTPRTLMVASSVAKRTGTPVVYHVHSPVGRDSTRWLQNWINLFVEKRSLRHVNKMIAVSDSIGQYMGELGYGPDRLIVVPNGVPIVDDAMLTSSRSENDFHSPWKYTLGTVALFRPRKGTEVLLDSVAELSATGLDVGLLAVGGFETPEYEAMLKAKVEKLGIQQRVHWTGFTRQVNGYFPKMDLFVLPSLFGEGLPMVVLESMAMGIPVVASRVEGIEQAIRQNVDGEISIPGDSHDLAQRIARLVSGDVVDLAAMGKAARQRQQETFSDVSMCQATAAVYDQILGTK